MDWWAWVIVVVVAVLILVVWVTNKQGDQDSSDMIGLEGVASETFSAEGMIHIRGELWRATTDRGIIDKGTPVRVVASRPGLILVVEKVTLSA